MPLASLWSCAWQGDKIGVSLGWGFLKKRIGSYELLPSPHCPRCSSLYVLQTGDRVYCRNCALLPRLDRISAVGVYYPTNESEQNLLSKHVRRLKRFKWYAGPLGQAMALAVQYKYVDLRNSDVLVPVPQHPEKHAARGYNQAEELAKVLSDKLGLPVADILKKVKNESERGERIHDRLEKTREMYAFSGGSENVQGKKIILVDDIVTLGATATACTKILKDQGAAVVEVLVAGRTFRPGVSASDIPW